VAELQSVTENIVSRFVTNGAVQQTVHVDVKGTRISFPLSAGQAVMTLKPLLDEAKPSPYGHGSETVVNTSVRNAMEILPGEFSLEGFKLDSILAQVKRELVPDAASVTAELHKLNVYSENGHFAKHKDTPRSESQFGSLVVVLPVPFEGGALVMEHGAERVSMDWGYSTHAFGNAYGEGEPCKPYNWNKDPKAETDYQKELKTWQDKKAAAVPTCGLQWAAFFGDVSHQVEKVKAGHRITLTYILHRVDDEASTGRDALQLRAAALQECLRQSLLNPRFLPEGHAASIFL